MDAGLLPAALRPGYLAEHAGSDRQRAWIGIASPRGQGLSRGLGLGEHAVFGKMVADPGQQVGGQGGVVARELCRYGTRGRQLGAEP